MIQNNQIQGVFSILLTKKRQMDFVNKCIELNFKYMHNILIVLKKEIKNTRKITLFNEKGFSRVLGYMYILDVNL